MAEVQKIGRVTFRTLTNEEALAKYGSSFVSVGAPPAPRKAVTNLKTNAKKSKRNPK